MPEERFESMLGGGHPNSLGRSLEVVEQDFDLKSWLLPQLLQLRHDKRASVARKAVKISTRLSE